MAKKQKPDLMERTRAAVAYVNSDRVRRRGRVDSVEVAAFMALFHPEYTPDQVRALTRGMDKKEN